MKGFREFVPIVAL